MLNITQHLLSELGQALQHVAGTTVPDVMRLALFEQPKQTNHGDLAVTAAMALAKPLGQSPRQIGQALMDVWQTLPHTQQWVAQMTLAGPGFINLTLQPQAKQQIVVEILQHQDHYGQISPRHEKVMVEFVSANPTGPLHVGHARQAALGDALCNLLASQGYEVHREFYYNDAGVQIQNLALSVQCRAKGIHPNDPNWLEHAYNGDYIADIAQAFCTDSGANLDVENLDLIRQFAVAYLRREQDLDLQAFALQFDHYYLESSLYTSGRVDQTVQDLVASGHTYEQEGALWLACTRFGDDKDRVMRKQDGTYTYFVPDVAYHVTKWERGFTQVINVQGSDHHGTMARVRAGLQALNRGIPKEYPHYVLHTMVRVVRGGQEVKISKRAGSYVTLRDLVEWTSKDAVRFFLLSRKPDTEYTFDVDLAIAKNNDNPVYYVQYAHARICNLLRLWQQHDEPTPETYGLIPSWWDEVMQTLRKVDLSPLSSQAALTLMMVIGKYPQILRQACADRAPHDVTFYLRELAKAFHTYYDQERILGVEQPIMEARLALVAAVAQVLRNGLRILGVSSPQKM